MSSSSSLSVDFTPQKKISSGRGNHSEQVDDIAESIKFELQGREFELSVDQLCTLLNIPAISPPESSSWPRNLFGETSNAETYHQGEAVCLLNHLWGAETHGFSSLGGTVFKNDGIGKRSAEKPDIVLLQNPDKEFFWANVLVVGEVKTSKTLGHPQICRYLRKVHQNRPGGSDYVGFLVAGRTLSVYVSNAAGLLKTTPIDLTVGKESLPILSDCIRIFQHAEQLSVPPFQGYLEYPGNPQFYCFTSPKLIFVKETMQGSRTAVWTGSLEGGNNPVIFKTCWLPPSLVNHERELVRILSSQQPWGITPFTMSGVRLVNGAREATPSVNQELVRYREISISPDNGYRAFEKHVKTCQEWITIIAGLSDIARILFLVWSKCQIHHRDISTGNIVFAPTPSTDLDFHLNVVQFLSTKNTDIATQPERKPMACLIDWANGRTHSTRREGPRAETSLEDAVSGTRPFLSIKMLKISSSEPSGQLNTELGRSWIKEQKNHLPVDDLESLYWVLVWLSAQDNDSVLQPWKCSNGGMQDKKDLTGDDENEKICVLNKFMKKWDSKSPVTKTIYFLLLDLSKTVSKLRKTFGRKGELETHPTNPDYIDNLSKADNKWAPLFSKFVKRLDKAVSDLDKVCQQR